MKRPGHQKKLEAVEMWTVIDCKAHDAVGVAMFHWLSVEI